MADAAIFATLRANARVWAVPAVHGERARLASLHRQIAHYFRAGDQIVYLGNYIGHGPDPRGTVDELLLFRRALLARDGVDCEDIIFLRGGQEEMWRKLLQIQFASNPLEILKWMLARGVGTTIEAYGGSVDDGKLCARDGTLSLTRWTGQLTQNLRACDGHTALMSALRHAAVSENESLLFVHAGLNPDLPLADQSDHFWWGGASFGAIEAPFGNFRRIVRGFDRRHGGACQTTWTMTLDAGCGFGGELLGACFAPTGELLQTVTA